MTFVEQNHNHCTTSHADAYMKEILLRRSKAANQKNGLGCMSSLFSFNKYPCYTRCFLYENFPKYCWAPNSLIWFHSVWHGLISSSSSVISLHQSVIFLHLQQKFLWVAWLSGVSKLLRLLQAEIGLLGTQQWLVGYWYWEEAQGICSSERIQSTGTSIPNWNCWDSRNEYDILLVTLMNEQTNPHSTPDIHHDILWWTPIYSL